MTGGSGGGISLVFADGRYLKLAGGQISGNITCAGSETFDGVDLSGLGTVYLALAGGEMAGNITFSGAQTVDGVDISGIASTYLALAGGTMAGDITLGNNAFLLSNTISSDHDGDGLMVSHTAGENLVFGDLVYKKSDGKWWKADADAAGTMPATGLAMATINAESSGKIMLQGYARDDSWGYTVGAILYADTTQGPPTETAPSGAGDQVQAVGIALSSTKIYLRPSLVLVEVAA